MMSCGFVRQFVQEGDLFTARRMAHQEVSLQGQFTASDGAWAMQSAWENSRSEWKVAASRRRDAERECAQLWQQAIVELFAREDYLHLVRTGYEAHVIEARSIELLDDCFEMKEERWHECCSEHHSTCAVHQKSLRCCAFGNNSRTFLRLPALREVTLELRLTTGRVLQVEQDGFLRQFEPSTVLWPAGYLLSLWASDDRLCANHMYPVLELGAGVGAPSVAVAATCKTAVLATDVSEFSQILVTANSVLNGVDHLVRFEQFNWHNETQLSDIMKQGPFSMIFGAAIKPEEWHHRLWIVLGKLCSIPSRVETKIVLTHSIGSSLKAPRTFVLQERISAREFGMHTMWDQQDSDFELDVYYKSKLSSAT